jgi:hypothetical protein
MVVFLAVLLRRFYQRATIRNLPAPERSAIRAAVWASAANWLTVLFGAIVISIVSESLFSGVPLLLKVWLIMPIIATLAGLYLLYKTVIVWSQGLLYGVWARVRYTVVALSALFMCWFYYFWNFLGWQFK